MSDFKFTCPDCGQNILINADSKGQRMECPSCSTKITVPAPPKKKDDLPVATRATTPTKPTVVKPAAAVAPPTPAPKVPVMQHELKTAPKPALAAKLPYTPKLKAVPPSPPAAAVKPQAAPVPKPVPAPAKKPIVVPVPAASSAAPAASVSKPAPKTVRAVKVQTPKAPAAEAKLAKAPTAKRSVAEPEAEAEAAPRVATLTPQIKLELVLAIRARIADASDWMPGKGEKGEYAYAAKASGDVWETVSFSDPDATRFSLFGAVMLELQTRNVVRASAGRRRFLDEELIAAIQQVLGRKADQAPPSEAEREALTHKQCLAVLDGLERRYQREADEARSVKTSSTVAEVRLTDLVDKMEQESKLRAEDVACALYHEVEELKGRLSKMEATLAQVMKPRA